MYMKNEIKSYNMLKQRVFGQKLKKGLGYTIGKEKQGSVK